MCTKVLRNIHTLQDITQNSPKCAINNNNNNSLHCFQCFLLTFSEQTTDAYSTPPKT